MPIVKFIERETNLPAAVAAEMDRYTANRDVPLQEYENYRNAAVSLHKRGKAKFCKTRLYKLADSIQDATDASDMRWAIGQTIHGRWIAHRTEYLQSEQFAKDAKKRPCLNRTGRIEWENELAVKCYAEPAGDDFEASLFEWRQRDSENRHPAILLVSLLDKYDSNKRSKA